MGEDDDDHMGMGGMGPDVDLSELFAQFHGAGFANRGFSSFGGPGMGGGGFGGGFGGGGPFRQSGFPF